MSQPEPATKQCPFCGETILAVAIKCKHCKSDLSGTAPPPVSRGEHPSSPPHAHSSSERPSPSGADRPASQSSNDLAEDVLESIKPNPWWPYVVGGVVAIAILYVLIDPRSGSSTSSRSEESGASCKDVGSHIIDVITRSNGFRRTSEWDENVSLEVESCRQKKYSAGARDCIMQASTAKGIDRCLGQ